MSAAYTDAVARVMQRRNPAPSRNLTEMTLMLLTRWAQHWVTGVTIQQACQEIDCQPDDLQPAFEQLERAGYIRKGIHGYIAHDMLRGLVAGMLIGARGVN